MAAQAVDFPLEGGPTTKMIRQNLVPGDETNLALLATVEGLPGIPPTVLARLSPGACATTIEDLPAIRDGLPTNDGLVTMEALPAIETLPMEALLPAPDAVDARALLGRDAELGRGAGLGPGAPLLGPPLNGPRGVLADDLRGVVARPEERLSGANSKLDILSSFPSNRREHSTHLQIAISSYNQCT